MIPLDTIIYREAIEEADAATIAALHTKSWRANYRGEYRDEYLDGDVFEDRNSVWQSRLADPVSNQFIVVAEKASSILGFACVYGGDHTEWGSFLDNIHVQPDLTGAGIGKRLMVQIFGWCQEHYPNCGLYLWVLNSNERAQNFYKALGAEDRGGEISEAPGGGEIHGRRYVWDRLPDLSC